MVDNPKVSVDAEALYQVLQALNGPPHLIQELLVLARSSLSKDDPIKVLTNQYNEYAFEGR